jgi:hypothetical protein
MRKVDGQMDGYLLCTNNNTECSAPCYSVILKRIDQGSVGQCRAGQNKAEQVEKQLENEEVGEEQYHRGVPRDRNRSKKDKEDEDW